MISQHRMGMLWVFLSALCYAAMPILTRLIYNISDFRPIDVALWRFVFATTFLWGFVLLRERLQPQKRPQKPLPIRNLLLLGICLSGVSLLAMVGLQYLPASLYIVLFFTFPAMVALISVFLGQPLHLTAWIAVALTLIGVVLTIPNISFESSPNFILGVGIALFNALTAALYYLASGHIMKGIEAMGRATSWVMIGTLLATCLLVPFFGLKIPNTPSLWLALIGLALIGTTMAFLFLNMGISIIGATQASIISTLEPVLTMIIALFVLGEIVLPMQWLGAILIVIAVILLEARPQPKVKVNPAE